MMIQECDQLIRQKHMHMERAKILYVRKKKLKRNNAIKQYKNV